MNLRTPITMLVLLAILLGAAYFGWRTVVSPGGDGKDDTANPSEKSGCTDRTSFEKGQRFRAGDIRINVYNAGSRSGLAGDTLERLSSRGFKAGVSDNAPDGITASNVTVMSPTPRAPQVRLVVRQFRGKVEVTTGPSLAPGIDVAVGDNFVGVDASAPKELRLRKRVITCVKNSTSAS